MSLTAWRALALGLVVLLVCARIARTAANNPATKWEGSFALLMIGAILGAPAWAGQGVLTFLATIPGDQTWWLWAAWWGAPLLGFMVGAVRRRPPTPVSGSS